MRRVPSLRALTAGLVLASLSLVAPPLAASAAPVAMRMVAPAVAVPVGDRVIGAMPSDQRISFGIYLAPRDASRLSSYAATVTNPRSASYRRSRR